MPTLTALSRTARRVWRWLSGWAKAALAWRLNAHFIVGIVAVVGDREGRVLLAHHTYGRRAPWALPGGGGAAGGRPEGDDRAGDSGGDRPGGGGERDPGHPAETPRHLTIIYAARLLGGEFRASDEVSEARFVRPGEWPEGTRADHKALLEGR